MEQALSRLDALCMPSGFVCYPLVAVGWNPFKSNGSSLLDYYVSYSSEPPAFAIMWFDPFGAVDIVWGNLRYIVEALDLIFQSRIIPGLLLPVGLILLLGVWQSFNDQSVFFRSYVMLYLGLGGCLAISFLRAI